MDRSTLRRGITDSTGNLGDGVLIFVKNGPTYSPLTTKHLSSFDPSSNYLAVTVKIKGASPIHLFNIYVPPIRSSLTLSLNPSHPSSNHRPLQLTFSAVLTAIIHPGTPTSRRTFRQKFLRLKNP